MLQRTRGDCNLNPSLWKADGSMLFKWIVSGFAMMQPQTRSPKSNKQLATGFERALRFAEAKVQLLSSIGPTT